MMSKEKSQDDKNIKYLESRYLYEKRRSIYIANEEVNQVWDESDIPDFVEMWNNKKTLKEISKYLGAEKEELQLLAIDLMKRGLIKGRVRFSR